MSDNSNQNSSSNTAGIGATETGSNTSDTIGAASDSKLTQTGQLSDRDQLQFQNGPVSDAEGQEEPQMQDLPGPSLTSTGSQGGKATSMNADEDLDQAMRNTSWTETGADVDPSLPNQLDADGKPIADPQAPPPGSNEANRKTLTAH